MLTGPWDIIKTAINPLTPLKYVTKAATSPYAKPLITAANPLTIPRFIGAPFRKTTTTTTATPPPTGLVIDFKSGFKVPQTTIDKIDATTTNTPALTIQPTTPPGSSTGGGGGGGYDTLEPTAPTGLVDKFMALSGLTKVLIVGGAGAALYFGWKKLGGGNSRAPKSEPEPG